MVKEIKSGRKKLHTAKKNGDWGKKKRDAKKIQGVRFGAPYVRVRVNFFSSFFTPYRHDENGFEK